MTYKHLIVEKQDEIPVIKFNRPKALNALNEEVLKEIDALITELEEQNTRVCIFTGEGKAFIAGADIAQMKDYNVNQAFEFCNLGQTTFTRLAKSEIISIAAVNGFALGGGLEFALSCDMRILADSAKIGLPEVSLGIMPGFGGTQRLARLIGKGLASELIFTGDMYPAEKAYDMGIANRITTIEELLPESYKLAKSILSRGKIAVVRSKEVIRKGLDLSLEEGLYQEKSAFSALFDGEESKEGLTAFLEKRKPNF